MAKGKQGDLVFQRGKDSDHDDIWDDSVLIAAYERAANLAYDAVHTAMQSNGEYSADDLRDQSVQSNKARERNGSFAGDSSMSGNDSVNRKSRKKKFDKKKWKIGDKCLAKYSEDGAWYEATVLGIDRSHNQCTVQYSGYGNEEEVNLGMLRRCSEVSLDDEVSSRSEREGEGEQKDQPDVRYEPAPGRFAFNMMSTMPPPVPPHLLRPPGGPPQEDEAVAAMLMSWYTSGYHTGYYQALRDMKSSKQ